MLRKCSYCGGYTHLTLNMLDSHSVHTLNPQIYTGDTRTCAIFILAWGSKWGSSGFSRNQNNRGSSGAYGTCIYCSLIVKISTHKTPHSAQRSWTHLFVFFLRVWSAKTQSTPNLSPMADDAITRGSIGGLGSPMYISVLESQV